MIKRIFIFLGIIVCLIFIGISCQIFTIIVTGHKKEAKPQIFEITKGQTTHQVAQKLYQEGLIRNALFFRLYSQLNGQGMKIRTGEYQLSATMRMSEILDIITLGKSISYPITLREGINLYEIADILDEKNIVKKEEFLKAGKDQEFIEKLLGERLLSLEGYLFPETYHFEKKSDIKDVMTTMVKRFLVVYSQIMALENAKTSLNRHDIVRLASLVEKETGVAHERPRIAGVFLNRLHKKMMLQSDPTIIYGILIQTGVHIKNIRKKHITNKNPYNTYTIYGLPLEPIANPGHKALHAVVFPEKTDEIYFVSRNDGTHYFSKTYDEHKKAVRKYQLNQ